MGRHAGKSGKTTTYSNANGEARFHVVDLEPTGYVVIAADDELETVLAFSHEDKFDAQPGSPLFDLLQRDTEGRMRQLHAEAASPSSSRIHTRGKAKWELLKASAVSAPMESNVAADAPGITTLDDIRVDPMIQSRWNQTTIWNGSSSVAVYNYYTPPNAPGDPNNYPTGCSATAWAQIMCYHQWPVTGVGNASFAITVDGIAQQRALRGGNGAGGPYDWANMVLIPGAGITLLQRQAIGALLHDAGVANNIDYAAAGSGALLTSAKIKNVFHYANGRYCCFRFPDILRAVRANLDAGLPLLLIISGPPAAHAVVCDGYGYNLSTLYHHLNMGWSGSSDAWYNLPNVGTYYGFDAVDGCSYNIDPAISGEILSGRITRLDGTPVAGCKVTVTGPNIHTVTTNQRGIFAVKGLDSNTAWLVVPQGGGYIFCPNQAIITTGTSGDNAVVTGDRIIDFQAGTQTGSLQINLTSQEAIAAGAQWQVDDGAWQNSGATVSGLLNVSHTVAFKTIGGWVTPESQTVMVNVNQTAISIGLYARSPVVTTLAGSPGAWGNVDGIGVAARFNGPGGVAVDGSGNVFVADCANQTIRKVTSAGVVSTFAGRAGSSGNADGTGSNAQFYNPKGLAVDSAGNIYVADTGNYTIRKITPAGVVSTFAGRAGSYGSTDGTGSNARFWDPSGVAVDGAGNVYVADTRNCTIRKIAPAGVVSTFAGLAGNGSSFDGTGSNARFWDPSGVAVDGAGNVYVADTSNHTIRKITPTGVVSTLAGFAFAGVAGNDGSADGAGSNAQFYYPSGVALDSAGNVYVADKGNCTIRKITPTGVVNTLTGLAGSSGSADGAGSIARFYDPRSVAADNAGNVYVADTDNNTIRKIMPFTPTPQILTQPQNQTAVGGQNVTLSVTATGTPPLTYQWRRNGVNIPGATGATYSIAGAQLADAGSYDVIVTNTAGSITSNAVTLTVNVPPSITTQPQSQTVPVGVNATFTVVASGTAPLSYQWKKGATILANTGNISGATNATLTLTNVQLADAGSYSVTVTNAAGTATSNAAALTAYVPTAAPTSQYVTPGSSVMFAVTTSGSGSPTYQWKLNGTAIPGATNTTYTVANAQVGNMGFYSVTVTNSAGSIDSAVAILTVNAGSSRLTALSTRGYVTAGGALTPGFYLRGNGSKSLIVRGVGPTLSGFGVASPLSDPRMDLIPVNGTTLLTNDDWGTNANLPALRAAAPFSLAEGSKDAAALITLSTATNLGYTVRIVPSGTVTDGIAMAEVYDLDAATAPVKFISLSTLGYTGPGEKVLTPGFIISGDGPKQLLIRAVGPTLGTAPYNVAGVLADPQFRVVPLGTDLTVASNDNWGGTAALQAAFTQTSDFALPTDSKDAAAIVRLPPGGYTIQASGVGGTTGNVLVEVYDMDP